LVIAGVYALTLLSPVVSIVVTTFLLTFLIFIPARMIANRSLALTYNASVLLIFLILVALIIITVLLIIPNLAQFVRSIGTSLDSNLRIFTEQLRQWSPEEGAFYLNVLNLFELDITQYALPLRNLLVGADVEEAAQSAAAMIETMPAIDVGQIVNTISQILGSLVSALTNFVSTLFMGLLLSLIILLELPRYQEGMLNSFPSHQRELRLLASRVSRVWQGFFRGQLTLCLIIGAITYLQLVLMGIPSAFIVAVLVALVSLIPTIGGIIALIPLAIAPLLQGSTVFTEMNALTLTLLVVGINFVISQIIWNVVAPKIMGDAVSLPLPLIFIGIIIGAALGGVLGAFLIVPILGTIRVVVEYLVAKITRKDPYPGEEMPDVIVLKKI
jgi:predicted PurR-regulated permease PerM